MAKHDSSARRRRATEWPDRDASRKRQRRRRAMLGLVAAIAVLPWFAFPWLRDAFRDWRGLPAADVATSPGTTAASVALPLPPQAEATSRSTGAEVATGASTPDAAATDTAARPDDAAAGASGPDGTAGATPQAPLPPLADADHPQERADARRAAMAVAGVRSAGWMARGQLLAVVDTASLRQPDVAGTICRAMSAHGDVDGVTVQLQHAAATTPAGRAMLATPCRRAAQRPVATIGAQPVGEDPAVVRARLRAEAAGAGADAAADGDAAAGADAAADTARAERDASLRILEDTTPEL